MSADSTVDSEEQQTDVVPVVWKPAEEVDYKLLVADDISPEVAQLLARRGIETAEQARDFLCPRLDHLHDPFLLTGMRGAIDRLDAARVAGEKIVLVGDYDVDGVTSAALLTAVFRVFDLEVETILPHRLKDGYGFQLAQVEQAREADAKLIVTVDCGTSSGDAIRAALAEGIDVIVTDHHLPGADFPSEAQQINPQLPNSAYPFQHLSGVGLALKLAQALSAHFDRELPLASLLRMACLGTVADVVPLVGENRVITALGLRALSQTRSPGLRALFGVSGVRFPLSSEDIGYRLGPRINAAGRLDSARAALDLLLARDAKRAEQLALKLDRWNAERQNEERRCVEEAREILLSREPRPGILLAWSDDWHRGVVGIAAGRLARELHRPTVLLAVEDDVATGSGRSIPGISLYGFLAEWRDRYQRFGGHEAAIGMTVRVSELELLREAWETAAIWSPELLERVHAYELTLPAEAITNELYHQLAVLEPHGPHNARPLLKVGPMRIDVGPLLFGSERQHAKARVSAAEGARFWMIGWGFAERAEELTGEIEALGYLEWDDMLGAASLRLVDVRRTRSEDRS